jgi:hypothetical protein
MGGCIVSDFHAVVCPYGVTFGLSLSRVADLGNAALGRCATILFSDELHYERRMAVKQQPKQSPQRRVDEPAGKAVRNRAFPFAVALELSTLKDYHQGEVYPKKDCVWQKG